MIVLVLNEDGVFTKVWSTKPNVCGGVLIVQPH